MTKTRQPPPTQVEELRSAAREANEAAANLRAATREAREVLDQVRAKEWMEQRVHTVVVQGLAAWGEEMEKVRDESVRHIIGQFDKLRNVLMYGNEQGKGQNVFEEAAQEYKKMLSLRSALQAGDLGFELFDLPGKERSSDPK